MIGRRNSPITHALSTNLFPIREGVEALVGKNNSGKTALLKALGASGSNGKPAVLPKRDPVVKQMTGYLHAAESMDAYEANVLFEVEIPSTIAGDQELWNAFVTEHRTLTDIRFCLCPRH